MDRNDTYEVNRYPIRNQYFHFFSMPMVARAIVGLVSFLSLSVELPAIAETSRLKSVLNYVRNRELALRQEILTDAGVRHELGLPNGEALLAVFHYEMAFQETILKSGIRHAITNAESLISESKQVVIPLCYQRRCILTVFDEDLETGRLQMVSYGASARAYRIAEAYARLKNIRPDYAGPIKIVEYPEGKLDFLLINGDGNGADVGPEAKVFLPATEEQSSRLGVSADDTQFLTPAQLSAALVRIDQSARRNLVVEGVVTPEAIASVPTPPDNKAHEGSTVQGTFSGGVVSGSEQKLRESLLSDAKKTVFLQSPNLVLWMGGSTLLALTVFFIRRGRQKAKQSNLKR